MLWIGCVSSLNNVVFMSMNLNWFEMGLKIGVKDSVWFSPSLAPPVKHFSSLLVPYLHFILISMFYLLNFIQYPNKVFDLIYHNDYHLIRVPFVIFIPDTSAERLFIWRISGKRNLCCFSSKPYNIYYISLL